MTYLTDDDGAITKTYEYDAFGNEENPVATDTNPFRYAGEYYDKETGTYYLRARYYDPVIGRFTQEDPHWNQSNMLYGDDPLKLNNYTYAPSLAAIIQSGNLYVYAMSNPVKYADENGEIVHLVVGGLAGAGIGVVAHLVTQVISDKKITLSGALIAAGSGAASGVLAASGVGLVGQIVGNGLINGAADATKQVIENGINNIDGWKIASNVGLGMIAGRLGGSGANSNNYIGSVTKQLEKRIGNAFAQKKGLRLSKNFPRHLSIILNLLNPSARTRLLV